MRKVRRYTVEEREEILSGRKSSGMKLEAYCRKRGIPLSTFHTWRRKYQKLSGTAKKGFIKVKFKSGEKPTAPIRIETPEGYRIEIPTGTDSGWIQGIIEAVRKR